MREITAMPSEPDREPQAPSRGFIRWPAEQHLDPADRLRLLEGGMKDAHSALGFGILDECFEMRRQMQSWTGMAASIALALLVTLLVATSWPWTPLYANSPINLDPSSAQPKRPTVWLVHSGSNWDEYSNGLRIINTWRYGTKPRVVYPAFPAFGGELRWRREPAGIVYHATESHPLPLALEAQRDVPRRVKYLLDYVRSRQLYHFLIDRSGRVFSVVPEDDIANHAGKSVWGDDQYVYVNLNSSFLGVAFENQAHERSVPITEAQVKAARLLTEMLRARYDIPAIDCVTHAQVSVNPSNMMIGYHTDWAGNFPFEQIGLSDNYAQPFAAMNVFGFDYDHALIAASGNRVWSGLVTTHEQVRQRAAAVGETVPEYKSTLRKRYREILANPAG